MNRIAIQPRMLRWARERAGLRDVESLRGRFPKIAEWETGKTRPTLKQLEAFANKVHVPIGYLFLQEPPEERLPIPDFRTLDGKKLRHASPDLLDTVYACQERQGWYREFSVLMHLPEVSFVGSSRLDARPEDVATDMARALSFSLDDRAACRTWEEALRLFIAQADKIGVMVMLSGVVLSNNHRTLDPEEFRGFALADRRAPVIFVNGADTKAGQMFTLAHELAHLWIGASAISDASVAPLAGYRREEVWCNAVAAELLVPRSALRSAILPHESLDQSLQRLARQFKVSSLVILRRLLDVGALTQSVFDNAWVRERARLSEIARSKANGGDFYRTTLSRVSHRFARAVIESTLEGQTLYRDAFRMLGIAKTATFNQLGHEAGVM